METHNLADTSSRTKVFQQLVLNNLNYWQIWLSPDLSDIAAIDRERDNIVRAISYTLDLEGLGWTSARQLIETFSIYMERRGHWEMWDRVLSRSIRVAQRVGDDPGVISLSVLLARLTQRQSRFADTIANYRRVIRLARHIGDAENEARACSNLGFLYTELGYGWRAEVLCCHALAIFERIEYTHGFARTHNHLGLLAIRQRRWQVAQQHLEQACQVLREENDTHGLMEALINLGHLFIETEQPDQALFRLNEALEYARATGEETEIANIYNNIGISYRLSGDPARAETYLWQAEAIFRRTSNILGLAQVSANLGLACLDQKKWTAAEQHFESALAGYQLLKNPYRELRIMLYLVKFELARSNEVGAAKRLDEIICKLKPYEENERYQDLRAQVRAYRQLIETSSFLP